MCVKRILCLAFFGLGLTIGVNAQEINGGAHLSFPPNTTLFGFSARFEGSINSDFQWMVTPGLQFGGGTTLVILRETPLYIGMEIGPIIGTGSGSETRFVFTPTVGYRIDEKWDLSFQLYAGYGSTFVGLRGAYVFKSK
jgi:hypothetical protein